MPGNLSRQSLEKGITWRDDREWLNGVLRDGEKNDGDHYMLMLGHTPYDDYVAFQRAPCDAFTRKKEIFRYRCDSLFRRIRSPRFVGIISVFGRRSVMATSSAIRPSAPWLLWYSRVKCSSYLSANEDRVFNWRAKVKFALLKINELRQLVRGRCSECVFLWLKPLQKWNKFTLRFSFIIHKCHYCVKRRID